MRDDVLAQPHQVADALWRTEAARVPDGDMSGGLLVCGMGGSAIGGDLAVAAIGPRAVRPVRTSRGYAPEPWLDRTTLVLCSSYSGTTEETLACFDAAGETGAERVALTTGGALAGRAREEGVPVIGIPSGMQPRASVVYMTVAVLQCAVACGAVGPLRSEIEAAGEALAAGSADVQAEAASLATALRDTLPVVHGAELTAPVARRWKTQINENAKVAAFASELPEANHNEIEGWAWGARHAPLSAVFLSAPDFHARVAKRTELLAELLEERGVAVARVAARGESPVARVLSLVMLGDLLSVELAELAGVDPNPVAAIEGFKRKLD